jgi:hypothetical protein
MLPKLILSLRQDTVCPGEPLTQTQDSLVDSLLKFHRVVKGAFRASVFTFGVFSYLGLLPIVKKTYKKRPYTPSGFACPATSGLLQ